MRASLFQIIFFGLSLIPRLTFANQDENSSNETIENIVLEVKNPTEINIGINSPIFIKDRIIKIKEFSNKTYLMGLKKGYTYLKSGNKKYNIQVLEPKEWSSFKNFNNQFKDHPSLKLEFIEEGPILSGEILIPTDLVFLLNWLESTNIKPKINLKFYDIEIKKFAIDTLSEKFGLQINDIDEHGHLHLKKVADKSEIEKINKLGFMTSSAASNGQELGTLEVEFVNITDSELKNLSPILPTEFQWTINEKIKLLSQIFNSDYSKLESIKKRSTKINLMLFENEQATYHSGGEFAIEQRSIYRNDIQWKTYGLFVDAMPVSINENEIKLNIKVKMSYVVSSDLNQPSLSQDSWQQNLRLEKNKALIVTNSLTNMFSRDKKNHLLFKSVPILNALFKGKSTGEENSNIFMMIKLTSKQE